MGHSCSTPSKGIADDESEAFLPSMSLSHYSGPFSVDGLNSTSFSSQYELGRGTDRVITVRNKITKNEFVAYKLPKIESPCNDPKQIKDLICKLQRLEHPNICKLYEAFDEPAFLILIYQKVHGEPLLESTIQRKKQLSERKVSGIVVQLIRAVLAGASQVGFVHGTLGPKHIIVDEDYSNRAFVIDLGIVGVLKQDPIHRLKKDTLSYVAPEIVEPWYKKQQEAELKIKINIEGKSKRILRPLDTHERAQNTTASDVWSVGVIMFQLMCGKLPFQGRSLVELAKKILLSDPEVDDALAKVSDLGRKVVKSMLAKDPRLRPTPDSLLENPFFAQVNALSDETICPNILGELITAHRESRFKKIMMKFIAEKLPPKKIRGLEKAFARLDKSGDGFVTLHELKKYLLEHPHGFNINKYDAETIFNEVNDDDDHVISLQEFIIATLDSQHVLLESALWDAFRSIDKDQDGKLSKQELSRVIEELGGGGRVCEEQTRDMLALVLHEIPEDMTFADFTHLVREEGARDKRYALGMCNAAMKSCSDVYKPINRKCQACISTM